MGVYSKFTDAQKAKAVRRHALGETARSLAKQHGISIATFYQWRNDFLAEVNGIPAEPTGVRELRKDVEKIQAVLHNLLQRLGEI